MSASGETSRSCARNRQNELGAALGIGIEFEFSALSTSKAAGNGEAETEARSSYRVFGAVEWAKHGAPLAAWDPGSVVRHFDSKMVGV